MKMLPSKQYSLMRIKYLYLILIFLLTLPLSAKEISPSGYYTIRVSERDTLYQIIKTHLHKYEYWKELLKFNHIKAPKEVYPGITLKIPFSLSKTRYAYITNLYGTVKYKLKHRFKIVEKKKQKFFTKGKIYIKTGIESKSELVMDSGTRLTLIDNTIVFLNQYSKGQPLWKSSIRLNQGAFYVNIPPSKKEQIVISTKISVVTLTSGECYTKIYPDNLQKIAVYYGKASVKVRGEVFTVPEGYGVVISKDSPPQKLFKLPRELVIQ